MATPQHQAVLLRQVEELPGEDGHQDFRVTGLAIVVCNCGYSSGWAAMDGLHPACAEHGLLPHWATAKGADLGLQMPTYRGPMTPRRS